jgi:hypothetical protein
LRARLPPLRDPRRASRTSFYDWDGGMVSNTSNPILSSEPRRDPLT